MRARAAIPPTIGPYQIVAPLGRGGMAEVFHARLTRIGGFERDVAIKVMLPEYSAEQEFVEMLLDEARLAAAIRHNCIVQMLDVGRERDLFYLVMELVEGRDLRSVLRAGGKMRVEAALYVVGEVLRGLHAVHTATDRGGVPRRIVHRDVSPSNVMIDRTGAVKLGDFGIAHASSRLSSTRKNSVKGKLRYMAPEQVLGHTVDHRADLYAVGVMLCEIVLGDVVGEMRRPTRFGPAFAWTPQLAARLPSDVANLCRRALSDDPNARYADAADFRREVVATLARRAPGYGADDIAREMFELDEGFLTEGQTLADGPRTESNDTPVEPALYEEQKPTTPMIQIPQLQVAARPPEKAPAVVVPTPLVEVPRAVAQPYSTLLPSSQIRLKGGPLAQRVWMAAAAFVVSMLLVGGVLSLGSSSSSASPQVAALPQAPQPIARPLVTRPATGMLTVAGPTGMSVAIGTTKYPPAPCRLELPPGHYEVKLRRGAKARPTVRRVTVAAGSETSLRL